MKLTHLAYLMMAAGAVSALVFAAGPLGSSFMVQSLFVTALLLLLGGAILRRVGGRQSALSGDAGGEFDQASMSLESLFVALKQLKSSTSDTSDASRFHDLVLDKTSPPMQEFLGHRQTLLDGIGFGPFAELMIGFARVERSINRCLSATADGNAVEATRCLEAATGRMKQCLRTLHKHHPPTHENQFTTEAPTP